MANKTVKRTKNYRSHQIEFPWDNFLLFAIRNSYLYECTVRGYRYFFSVCTRLPFNLDGTLQKELAKEKFKLRILIAVTNTFECAHIHTNTHGMEWNAWCTSNNNETIIIININKRDREKGIIRCVFN